MGAGSGPEGLPAGRQGDSPIGPLLRILLTQPRSGRAFYIKEKLNHQRAEKAERGRREAWSRELKRAGALLTNRA